jgi:hypothetical protein
MELIMAEEKSVGKKVPMWVWIVGGLLLLGLIVQGFGGGEQAPETATPEQAETVEEEAEVAPEATPAVVGPFADVTALQAAIEQTIGSTTAEGADRALIVDFEEMDVLEDGYPGWLYVSYARDESRSKAEVWEETERIFLLARQADFVQSFTLALTTVIVNNLGEEVETSAFVTNFDANTFSRINTENVVGDLYEDAATMFLFDSRVDWGN